MLTGAATRQRAAHDGLGQRLFPLGSRRTRYTIDYSFGHCETVRQPDCQAKHTRMHVPKYGRFVGGGTNSPFFPPPQHPQNAPSALRAPLRAEAHAQETHPSDLRLQGYKRLEFRGVSFYLTENDYALKTSQHRCTYSFAERKLRGGAEGLTGNLFLSLFFSCCTLLLC